MIERIFAQFIAKTRSVPFTRRCDEIELDGRLLHASEAADLLAEFETWEPPPGPDPIDVALETNPLVIAMVRREARKQGKTVEQVAAELKAEILD